MRDLENIKNNVNLQKYQSFYKIHEIMWSQIIEIQLYGNSKLNNLNIKNAKKIIQCNYTSLWEKNLVSISICEMNLLPLISGIFFRQLYYAYL